jgi:transcriptional regulator with XRE-family HTH domain
MAKKKPRTDDQIKQAFGLAVRTRREELSKTQDDLAELASMHRTYLSDIERGFRNPSLINLCHLATALGLTTGELFDRFEEACN